MIYHLPTLLFLVCAGGSGGAFAAPSEPAAVRVPLELTLPPIQSDQYTRTDYIDGNENPVEGSGEKTKSCSIQPLIDYRSLVLFSPASPSSSTSTYMSEKYKERLKKISMQIFSNRPMNHFTQASAQQA